VAKQIDTQHVVDQGQRVADVRPWSIKVQEKLSDSGNFVFFGVIVLGLCIAIPLLLPVSIVVYLLAHFSVMSLKNVLPFRYPAHRGLDPETKKKANGIMYIGGVRSESPFEKFKQCWLSDSDLRKHWLIMGSTGSGKSETLKGIFYNTLCWGSGFFCADGKADNKLPTDGYTMARAFGRDDDILALNFLLGGKTPQQVAKSRRRRSNMLNPFSSGDADTLIQMGANLLPKAEGDGKSWQEKALVVWRAVITALCYKRDTAGFTVSVGCIIDYLSLTMIEELYIEGYKEAQESADGSWSHGYASIKNYLEAGCPAYSVEKLLKKHNLADSPSAALPAGGRRPAPGRDTEQDPAALEQHGYRVGQLMPVLNLLDKTYGYIFRASFSEIDMIDVALHNRILFLLIPSLEKSSQEAENLGKLSIACLRVMMARNLGSELEGSREELLESKATQAPYPYVVALDELGYYFADGIAVMFAQARSLGISMMAAAQDLEKLTEGSRAAEAGAMIGNTVNKIFMKIDDPEKTWKLVSATVGKVQVASYGAYEAGKGAGGYKREMRVSVGETDMITYQEMQKYTEGQAVMNALGVTRRISTFYMGDWLEKLNNQNFHLNRFLQVAPPSPEDLEEFSIKVNTAKDTRAINNGNDLLAVLRGTIKVQPAVSRPVFTELARVTAQLDQEMSGIGPVERGAVLYLALKRMMEGGVSLAAEHDIETGPIPASAALLGSDEAIGLAQALDEHGLPDPLSLIRKPISDVLAPVQEEPKRTPIKRTGFGIGMMGGDPNEPLSIPAGLPDFDFAGMDADSDVDPIDEILAQGRPAAKPGGSAAWVNKAIGEAHKMAREPRSANNTVVGLSDDTMAGLESLESELGSSMPKSSAQAMQKVVSAQVTPDTVGRGGISEDEIEDFFNNVMSGKGASGAGE
jgi:intracellular multiplication protein IcmO